MIIGSGEGRSNMNMRQDRLKCSYLKLGNGERAELKLGSISTTFRIEPLPQYGNLLTI